MPPRVAPNQTAATVPKSVVLSLYRSLLKEVRVLDTSPVMKVLLPLPTNLQKEMGALSPLYTPGGASYAETVRTIFRNTKAPNVTLGFEALGKVRVHIGQVSSVLPKMTGVHAGLVESLAAAQLATGAQYEAKVARFDAPALPEPKAPRKKAKKALITKGKAAARDAEANVPARKIRAGLGLVAHPLSSAHDDRRVVLIVDSDADFTTGIVLDVRYSLPLSYGNPMFPEVFWGQPVYNGGHCHIALTMPPTAGIAVLHTLEPPTDKSSEEYYSWRKWMKSEKAKGLPSHHELLCKPLIKGKTLADGSVIPTLYYSGAEALPYLASLCPGKLRSSTRVYWGLMRWPTKDMETRVDTGMWMPVELSANFFKAYSFPTSGTEDAERFPTVSALTERRKKRMKALGADVTLPHTYAEPSCGRESLWDQIMYSLGGEFTQLVGTINPFSNPRQEARKRLPTDARGELGGRPSL